MDSWSLAIVLQEDMQDGSDELGHSKEVVGGLVCATCSRVHLGESRADNCQLHARIDRHVLVSRRQMSELGRDLGSMNSILTLET